MNSDEAKIRIDAARDDDWEDKLRSRVHQLPRKLKPIARDLVISGHQGQGEYLRQRSLQRIALAALDELKDAERLRVMNALHPQLGSELAAWWTAAIAHPYSRAWWRRGFRAPNNPRASLDSRGERLGAYIVNLAPYARDITWVAEWAGHHHLFGGVGPLLAASIDSGSEAGDAVFDTLASTVRGDHSVGIMGTHAIVGLLRAGREDGWSLIEGLLLAAQRQEGLRQSILEAADEACLPAFQRILELIEREKLTRFAATIRALATWIGCNLDASQTKEANALISQLSVLLVDPSARTWDASLGAQDTYVTLIAEGICDADAALVMAEQVLRDGSPENRVVAASVMYSLGQNIAGVHLVGLLGDHDIAVAWHGFRSIIENYGTNVSLANELLGLAERMPKKVLFDPVVFELSSVSGTQSEVVVAAMQHRGKDSLDIVLPFVDCLDAQGQWRFANEAALSSSISRGVRSALLTIVGGRSSTAQARAMDALGSSSIESADAEVLEPLLTRKATALRQGVVQLLSSLPEDDRVESASRLWETGTAGQQEAACTLLATVDSAAANGLKLEWAEAGTDRHRELLGVTTPDTGGISQLFDATKVVRATKPKKGRLKSKTLDKVSAQLPGLIDDLYESHKNAEVTVETWQGTETILLADLRYPQQPIFYNPDLASHSPQFVLGDIVGEWWDEWAASRGDGAAEMAGRALIATQVLQQMERLDPRVAAARRKAIGQTIGTLRHPHLVHHALGWLSWKQTSHNLFTHCLDVLEWQIGHIPTASLDKNLARVSDKDWRALQGDIRGPLPHTPWYEAMAALSQSAELPLDLLRRQWGLLRWIDQPTDSAVRMPPDNAVLLPMHERGVIDHHHLIDALLAGTNSRYGRGQALRNGTKRQRDDFVQKYPRTAERFDQLREVAVEAELLRGELPTATTPLVSSLSSVEGAEIAVRALAHLGSLSLSRGYAWGDDKKGTLSHLIQVCYPAPDDSAETLRAAAQAHGVKEKRLVDFGVYAPHWASIVEEAIGWPGFEDAVWWLHAHTKDRSWSVEVELRERWEAASAERTPLTSEDLLDGAVDVEWFERVRATLGDKRLKTVLSSSKYTSAGSGHRRAVVFADALSGTATEAEMTERIENKRHQDTVRALGLVPLPKAKKARVSALLGRYVTMREFERTSSKFGSQRQISERNAARIGIENLARNAGYRDPSQFSWAMEAEQMADLNAGPIVVVKDDVTVTLSVDVEGVAQLEVDRAGKALKSVPAKLRKDPTIAPIRERKTALVKQVSRVRRSLEAALVNADGFDAADIKTLRSHPIVSPMLSSLVLVDEDGAPMRMHKAGYLDADGEKTKPSGALRLAHPADLLETGTWSRWQQWCFSEEIRQPFKQLFREVYIPTETEMSEGPLSDRYSGHQVQPNQARGLFKARGWSLDNDSYRASRVFHADGLVARVGFANGFLTPAEVELPTIGQVWFSKRQTQLAQPIDTIPHRLFSEAMRDLDLVVSVAHAGGVDPEASASTVEMRKSLAVEMVRLLKLDNVEFTEMHALIDGSLGEYSLHLGSGVVHRRPGGHIFIMPVHAQRRGRLFLPFADDDPRTAEVMTKLLTFSRDDKIQDPTILRQLRAA